MVNCPTRTSSCLAYIVIRPSELLFISVVFLLWFLPVPVLTALAYREWVGRTRAELPSWRSSIGLTSMVATLCNWAFLVVLTLLESFKDTGADFFTDRWGIAFLLLATIATLLTLALRGISRLEAAAAGLIVMLMAVLWLMRSRVP
jgi:branched-subunit amino acid transport protein